MNSEGTEVREPESVAFLRVRATAQSADGMTLRDAVTFTPSMPRTCRATRKCVGGITALAENLVALAHAPMGEDYNGPVLFEGAAARRFWPKCWRKNLTLTRRPVAEGGRGGGAQPSELEGRMGARVLPESFDVVDDPTQKEWRGRPLFGSYESGSRRRGAEAAPAGREGRAQELPADAAAGARL